MPDVYAERALDFVNKQLTASQHIEFYLSWSTHLLTMYANKDNVLKQQTLIATQDSLTRKYEALNKISDYNKYTMKVLLDIADTKEAESKRASLEKNSIKNGEDDIHMADSDDDEDLDKLLLVRKRADDSDQEFGDASESSNDSSDDD